MLKPRILLTLCLITSTSVAAFGSTMPEPRWWKRQMTFGSHSDRAGWDANVGTAEQWFNLTVLVITLIFIFYFGVLVAGRVYRDRQKKAFRARSNT